MSSTLTVFQALAALMAGATEVTITLRNEGNQPQMIVMPTHPKAKNEPALNSPWLIEYEEGEAEAEVAMQLSRLVTAHAELADSVNEQVNALQAAKAKHTKGGTKAIGSSKPAAVLPAPGSTTEPAGASGVEVLDAEPGGGGLFGDDDEDES